VSSDARGHGDAGGSSPACDSGGELVPTVSTLIPDDGNPHRRSSAPPPTGAETAATTPAKEATPRAHLFEVKKIIVGQTA